MAKVIATVLARGGSKGLPGKNSRPFMGRPLLAHTISQALDSGLFESVVFSSDDKSYLALAAHCGADLVIDRPKDLAGDQIGKLSGIRHAVLSAETHFSVNYDFILDLAVTSPLRSTEDISGVLAKLTRGASLVLSCKEAADNPYFNLVEPGDDGAVRLCCEPKEGYLSRQSAPRVFALNGAAYGWAREELFEPSDTVVRGHAHLYEMPADRSLDIDTALDFLIAEQIAGRAE